MTYLDPSKIDIERSVNKVAPLGLMSYTDLRNLLEGSVATLPSSTNPNNAAFSPQSLAQFWASGFTSKSQNVYINGTHQEGYGANFSKPGAVSFSDELILDVNNSTAENNDVILLYEIKLPNIQFVVDRYTSISDIPGEIIILPEKQNPSLSDTNDARIRGTTITIPDLVYNPSSDHRLFIKDSRYKPSQKGIAYRGDSDRDVVDDVNDTKMFFGPSFLSHRDLEASKELSRN